MRLFTDSADRANRKKIFFCVQQNNFFPNFLPLPGPHVGKKPLDEAKTTSLCMFGEWTLKTKVERKRKWRWIFQEYNFRQVAKQFQFRGNVRTTGQSFYGPLPIPIIMLMPLRKAGEIGRRERRAMIKKKLKLWRWKIKFLMWVPTMIFHRAYVRMTSALGGVRWVQSRGRLSVERIISSRTSFPMRLVSRVLTGWYMVGLSRVIAKSDRCVQRICRSCDNEPEYVYPPEHGEFRATLFQLRNQLTTQFRARSDLQPAELTSTPARFPMT